jgi:pterin-4a-carbinolamine dehydratase
MAVGAKLAKLKYEFKQFANSVKFLGDIDGNADKWKSDYVRQS